MAVLIIDQEMSMIYYLQDIYSIGPGQPLLFTQITSHIHLAPLLLFQDYKSSYEDSRECKLLIVDEGQT